MKQSIQEKIDEIKRMASTSTPIPFQKKTSDLHRNDSLAKVIRTQKDADRFMIELEIATRMAEKAAEREKQKQIND